MIDIKATRGAFEMHYVFRIGWIRSHSNIADGLTKLTICDVLESLLDTGNRDVTAERWIIRKEDELQNFDKETVMLCNFHLKIAGALNITMVVAQKHHTLYRTPKTLLMISMTLRILTKRTLRLAETQTMKRTV